MDWSEDDIVWIADDQPLQTGTAYANVHILALNNMIRTSYHESRRVASNVSLVFARSESSSAFAITAMAFPYTRMASC